ncbi:MAG: 50S ribosomal protein L18 [Eubacteriales bacterium]|nr:50S ribosomal protein L18 [Eubacteriales bacterium]MDD4421961.1 50S ribosomal protein L18 [Eubacteriales bacterium]
MVNRIDRNKKRLKRHKRVRAKVFGTSERPRLCVYRSNDNIYVQIIDDTVGKTLVSASSVEPEFGKEGGNKVLAKKVGELAAKRALEQNITSVIFDRGGYLYHGRVKELADGAREAGLNF